MKRKDYQRPTMQVVKLQPFTILAGSGDSGGKAEGFSWDEED